MPTLADLVEQGEGENRIVVLDDNLAGKIRPDHLCALMRAHKALLLMSSHVLQHTMLMMNRDG